ncbi:GNAT family N-acetyltransferase [Enterocloster bolteae]|uniref:GNAT family N-acetyltransferase n=1 Tax=Enterocloster bolteae TaxID=208479 RepID=UPI002666D1D0|nr:GNAT family N-acetyltransferase [Enterocloster bolteae]
MTYRFADTDDLDQLVAMSDQAKESFKARNIDQWQKGEPNRQVMEASIRQSQLHVLEDMGQVVGMITIVPGPEASYASIDGAWLNQEPYYAFHRVCVKDSLKGRGLAARLFSEAEQYVLQSGIRNIRIDTHPDNQAMQRALAKSGYIRCGTLILTDVSDAGVLRVGYPTWI